MNRNWTNDTRKLLGEAHRNAPEGLLDDIKQEMACRGLRPAYGEPKARVVSLRARRWMAVTATVAVVIGLGVFLMPHDAPSDLSSVALREDSPSHAPSLQSSAETVGRRPADEGLPTAVAAVRAWVAQVDEAVGRASQSRRALLASAPEAAASEGTAVSSIVSGEQPDVAAHSGEAPQQAPSEVRGKVMSKSLAPGEERRQPVERSLWAEGHDSRPVQVAAHVSGMPSANLNGVAGDQYMKLYDAVSFGPNSSEQGSSVLSGLGHAKVPGVKAKHYQPIRVGVSVRVPVGHRWSLQAGVNYAYLKSEFKDVVRPKDVVGTQTLHYLGVPVSVSYDVWDTRRLNVYAAAGGEVEQLVKGTYKSGAGDERVKERRPVMSVNAAAGAAFKLSQSISLYAEPGLSYHFKNGSGVESAYTDRPLGFSLNVGLRWNAK